MTRLLQQILGATHPSDRTLETERPEVFAGIENCYNALIDTNEDAASLSSVERVAVALRVAALHGNAALTSWFTEVLNDLDPTEETANLAAGCRTVTSREAGTRLAALINYATQQALEPAAISRLRVMDVADQFSPQEVVFLSELVAYVAYLVRIVSGMQLLRGLEGA